jgi:hypothetical protein
MTALNDPAVATVPSVTSYRRRASSSASAACSPC